MPEIPLIGRDDDLTRLRAMASDVVVVGKPGIGKTFLLQQLTSEDWGLFDDGWPVDDVKDAIRDLQPLRVIVDDAHLNEDRLAMLRQVRIRMDATFHVVAVSWPGQQAQVVAALPGANRFEVGELDRGQILEVVTATGVAGPRELQANLVDESMGRAGLAVTLAYACITGRVNAVASGQALLIDVVEWFARSLGRETRHVLGVLALPGDGGATIAQVADALGLTRPSVSDLVRGLASGGTLDEAPSNAGNVRLTVQPESLRYALVSDVFFSGLGSLELSDALAQLENPSASLVPLIGAVYRGANIDRGFLLTLLDPRDPDAVIAFALLGPSETSTVLDSFPSHSATIARAAYSSGINHDRTLRILMELAVGDMRDERSAPDHPLRTVSDYLHGPRGSLDQRSTAVFIAKRWLADGEDTIVGFRVLMHAVHPGGRMVYSDPGFGHTFTIAESTLPIDMVIGLGQLWDTILDRVEQLNSNVVTPVIDELHPWVHPGSLAMGKGADQATSDAMRDIATRVISRLTLIWSDRPGALRRLSDYVQNARLPVWLQIPPKFDALFPRDWDGSDENGGYAGWTERVQEAVRRVASDFRSLPAAEVAARMKADDSEAINAGVNHPRLTPYLAEVLANHSSTPVDLLTAFEQEGVAPDVLLPFMIRLVDVKSDGWQVTFGRLLADDRWSSAAIHVAITNDVGADLKDSAIRRMKAGHSRLVEFVLARGEADADTIERLLNAPDSGVARSTAVGLAQPSGKPDLSKLTPAARARWRQVIVGSPADEYWYSMILGRDPDLLADWLRAWLKRVGTNSGDSKILSEQLLNVISELPMEVRLELLAVIPSGAPSILLQDVVTKLVSDDAGVANALLSRPDLKNLHWTALRDGPNEKWMDRALVALRMGREPQWIVGQTKFTGSGWAGEESMQWQVKIDAFESLRRGDDAARNSIIAAGVAMFEALKTQVAAAEHRERVFGVPQ